MTAPASRGKTVVVVGAGGNIGSHLVPHLARTPDVGRVVLVDGDTYTEPNLWSQQVRRRDLGRPKAAVQKRVLREIDGGLAVEAIEAFVEDVPLGRLRGDVLLSAVDSKAARRSINAIATRLGMAWVDAGVHGEAELARINVYRPGTDEPCHECAWDDEDYATIEARHPCGGGGGTAVATNAASSLGALAAACQAIACRHVLVGAWEAAGVGCQVVVQAAQHRTVVSTLRRNPRCRLDHARWEIAPLDADVTACTLAEVFAHGRRRLGTDPAADVGLGVVGQVFATRLACLYCDATRSFDPYLFARLGAAGTCPHGHGPMQLAGFDAVEWLQASALPPALLAAPLAHLGLRGGDVVSLSHAEHVTHLECGGHP